MHYDGMSKRSNKYFTFADNPEFWMINYRINEVILVYVTYVLLIIIVVLLTTFENRTLLAGWYYHLRRLISSSW